MTFRIATPTGEPLPEPAVATLAAVDTDGAEGIRFTFDQAGSPAVLPHEAFLRDLLMADPHHQADLVVLCRTVGQLTLPPEVVVGLTNHPSFGMTQHRPLIDAWSAFAETAGNPETNGTSVSFTLATSYVEYTTRLLQALVHHWLEPDDAAVVSTWGFLLGQRSTDLDRCWAVFNLSMNLLLRPFAPTITVDGLHPRFGVLLSVEARPTPAHTLALQLYNAIVDTVEPRTCPECGTRFLRQEGRAVAGQHRTRSVTYCSNRCARLKADRDYKARKRAERK